MMQSITFTCEVITPMFLAGADGTTPELRPASIKGALRFWWRAMNGHLVGENGDLTTLKNREAEIFGGSGKGQGRSKVVIRVQSEPIETSYQEFNQSFYTYEGNGNRKMNGRAFRTNPMYYLGFGVANWVKEKNQTLFVRPYIVPGTIFKVILKVSEDILDECVQSFKALEQFGGLGAKSRNAYGCFKILETENYVLKNISIENLKSQTISNYSSFSNETLQFSSKIDNYKNWEEAFKNLCMAYQYARENVEYWHEFTTRELIGLPIVVKDERGIDDNFIERHTKPYFMHITKTEKGYKSEILLLPYNYLKDNPDVSEDHFENNKADYFDALIRFNELLGQKLNLKN